MSRLLLALTLLVCIVGITCAQEQPWCGIQTLYFQNNNSTSPPGYNELINHPSGNTEVDINTTITNANGWVLIGSYITPEDALYETTGDLAGLRIYTFYSYVSNAVGTTQLNFTPSLRFTDGSEKYFYSAISDDINDLAVNTYTIQHVSQTSLAIKNDTDRLVIRVYAKTTHPSPISVHFVYQGAVHTSNVESGYFTCYAEYNSQRGESTRLTALSASPVLLVAALGILILYKAKKK